MTTQQTACLASVDALIALKVRELTLLQQHRKGLEQRFEKENAHGGSLKSQAPPTAEPDR